MLQGKPEHKLARNYLVTQIRKNKTCKEEAMKKLLIIVFGLQCVLFCIDLQEIENKKFYEVSIFSEENNILAKDSSIKNGSLAIYVFLPLILF